MRPMPEDAEGQDLGAELRPSKSARKRAAHAAQKLGEALIELKVVQLQTLPMPEELYEAILEAQRIRKSRGGIARQRQYIGKLMRTIDPAPIEAALAAKGRSGA